MAQTLSSIASLLWPLIVIVALVIFRHPLLRIVRSAEHREWILEVGGQKLTMKQLSEQQNSMITDLQKQIGGLSRTIAELTADHARAPDHLRLDKDVAQDSGDIPAQTSVVEPSSALAHSALWVDDHPENNALLIEELQRNSVRVDLAGSTREGLALLNQRRYGIVLSDMGRVEDGREVTDAGLRLLQAVRETDTSIPFLIYCSVGAAARYREQALANGATAITSSPTDVSKHLQSLGLV